MIKYTKISGNIFVLLLLLLPLGSSLLSVQELYAEASTALELRLFVEDSQENQVITPKKRILKVKIDPTETTRDIAYQMSIPAGLTFSSSLGENDKYQDNVSQSHDGTLVFKEIKSTIELTFSINFIEFESSQLQVIDMDGIPVSESISLTKGATSSDVEMSDTPGSPMDSTSVHSTATSDSSDTSVTVIGSDKTTTPSITNTGSSDQTIRESHTTPHVDIYHSVQYVSDGTQVDPTEVKEGETVQAPVEPTRSGYQFTHWSLQEKGAAYDFNQSVTKDLILYAVWTPEKTSYSVVFCLEKTNIIGNPGTDRENYQAIGNIQQETQSERRISINKEEADKLMDSDQDLRKFKYVMPTGYGSSKEHAISEFDHADQNVKVSGNGATVVYVYYRRIVFTFHFNNSSTLIAGGKEWPATFAQPYSFQAKYQQDISNLWPVESKSANFGGWDAKKNNNNLYTTLKITPRLNFEQDLIPNDPTVFDITFGNVYAQGRKKATVNKFYQTLDDTQATVHHNNKNYIKHAYPVYLSEKGSIVASSATGYITPDQVEPAIDEQGDEVYNYYYDLDTYTLTFDYGDQALNNKYVNERTIKLKYTQKIPKPIEDKLVKDGFKFAGWYNNSYHDQAINLDKVTMPATDTIYFAKWQGSKYTVTYLNNIDGNILTTQTYGQGDYVTFPSEYVENQSPAGSTDIFKGWYYQLEHGRFKFFDTIPVTKDLTLFATWAKNQRGPVDPVEPPKDGNGAENEGTQNTGVLRLDYVPSKFDFGKVILKVEDQVISAIQSLSQDGKPVSQWIQVSDVRDDVTGWQVNVSQEEPFKSDAGEILAGTQLVLPKGKAYNSFALTDGLTTDEAVLTPGTESTIFSANANQGKDVSTDVWSASEVKLKLPRGQGKVNQTYHSTINWNLATAPDQ